MSETGDLAGLIERLASARVLVIGDVMLDRFVYGAVERISPEGPIPILRIERDKAMLGGAGNVLSNVCALGAEAVFLSVLGDDPAGREIRGLFAEVGQAEPRFVTEPGRITSIKERYIAGSQQLLRADRETVASLSAPTARSLIAGALDAVDDVSALVLSDYGKGVLEPATLSTVIGQACDAGLPVVVDPKGQDYGVYRGASVVTPNRRELQEATGLPVGSDQEIEAACRALISNSGVAAVLATRSEQGMTLVSEDRLCHLPAETREVFDVSGAGDTVVAILGTALAAGMDLEQGARLANVAAGIVVGKMGTAVAHPGELLHSLHSSDLAEAESKVLDGDSLSAAVERWRQNGLKVGFTNGCFDLLHPGHISLLSQARAACDRLVVGLNSDASVKRLKGAERPVQSEASRAAVLASIGHVDAVAIFGEDTPMRLIEALRPDILVKGADYSLEQVVGADFVTGYGGRVVLADLVQGHSTTNTIRKLAGES